MGFDHDDWQHLVGRLAWIEDRVRAKGATAPPVEFLPPIDPAQVDEFTRATGLQLPTDFANLVTKFTGGWCSWWCLFREHDRRWLRPPVPGFLFGGNGKVPFIGATAEVTLLDRFQRFQEEIHDNWLLDDSDARTWAAMPSAFPLLTHEAGGANFTVLRLDTDPCEVVHLDYECCHRIDREHTIGRGLGDFLRRWAAIGFLDCAGLDSLVDPATRLIATDSPTVRAWVDWLDDPEALAVEDG